MNRMERSGTDARIASGPSGEGLHSHPWLVLTSEDDVWLEADDMNERFCLFDKRVLGFPATELHLLLFMARPAEADADPCFPLCFEPGSEANWPNPAFVRIKSDPLRLAVDSPQSLKSASPKPETEAESEDESDGSSGPSFASIASEHVRRRSRSKRKSQTPKPNGVTLKKACISLRRCDDF